MSSNSLAKDGIVSSVFSCMKQSVYRIIYGKTAVKRKESQKGIVSDLSGKNIIKPNVDVEKQNLLPVKERDLKKKKRLIIRDESYKPLLLEVDFIKLCKEFPREIQEDNLVLIFAAGLHGYNLETGLRNCANSSLQKPMLIVARDTKGFVFGAFCAEHLYEYQRSHITIGSGLTFLFSLKPKFRVYKWTKADSQMLQVQILLALASNLIICLGQSRFYCIWKRPFWIVF